MKHVILGGTGTLGRALTRKILENNPHATVLCVSRDELKQKDVAKEFAHTGRFDCRLGDVRDMRTFESSLRGAEAVFLVAAYKHVDIAETNPEECIRTNVMGAINVADAATIHAVPYVVFSSTDKAVDPVNVYGFSKALAERLLLRRNGPGAYTKFSVFRWGNILGSRGSVLHSFAESLTQNKAAAITHMDMSRFWMNIDDAAGFMLENYANASEAAPVLPEVKAAPVVKVIATMAKILKVHQYDLLNVGIRPGEKIHEVLTSQHSKNPIASNTHEQYSDDELESCLRRAMNQEGILCPS